MNSEFQKKWLKNGCTYYGKKLFPLQSEVITRYLYPYNENLLVVGATGTGKTLVGEYAAINALSKGKTAFYLVPTRAIASETEKRWTEIYKSLGIKYYIATRDHTENDDVILEGKDYHMVVSTYEKFASPPGKTMRPP